MKKKALFRQAAFLMAMIILTTCIASGCGKKSSSTDKGSTATTTQAASTSASKFPQLDKSKRITVSIMHQSAPSKPSEVTKALGDKFNFDFVYVGQGASGSAHLDKLNLLMAANDMPDHILVFSTGYDNILKNGAARYTLEEAQHYMPNVMKDIETIAKDNGQDPNKVLQRNMIDGKIVKAPNIWWSGQWAQGIVWRKDILDELGKKVPETLSEWEDVFKAFKAKYPDQYPYSACGKTIWQSFPSVLQTTGLDFWQWTIKNGKMVPGYLQPEFKEPLELLQKWYKAGYIDPEWPTMDTTARRNKFINGKSIVIEFIQYWEMECTPPYVANSIQEMTAKTIPNAKFVLGPRPIAKQGVKPAAYTWDIFTGNGVILGKHLENDKMKMYRIMDYWDQLNSKEELYYLAKYGFKGVHYDLDSRGVPVRKPGAQTTQEIIELGILGVNGPPISLLWTKLDQLPEYMAALEKYVKAPNSMYSKEKLNYVFDKMKSPATSPSGEDLIKKYYSSVLEKERDTMFMKIVTGAAGLDEYDKFAEFWKKNGGLELEEAENRLYLNLYQK